VSRTRATRTPLGVRCFSAALRILPRDVRRRHGPSMLEVFEALYEEARAEHGWRGALTVTLAELPGLVRLAVVSRVDRDRSTRSVAVPTTYHHPVSSATIRDRCMT